MCFSQSPSLTFLLDFPFDKKTCFNKLHNITCNSTFSLYFSFQEPDRQNNRHIKINTIYEITFFGRKLIHHTGTATTTTGLASGTLSTRTVSKMAEAVVWPGVVSSAEAELVLTLQEVTADVSAVDVRGPSVSVDVFELQRVDFPVEYFLPNPRTLWLEKKTITLRRVRPRYSASCDFCWLVGRGFDQKGENKIRIQ